MICLDVETEGLHFKDGLTSIGFTSNDKSIAFGVNHPEQEHTEKYALEKIQRIVDRSKMIVNQHTKFDLKFLLYNGITFKHKPLLIDTQILYWLASGQREKQVSLNVMSSKLLGKTKVEGLDFKKKKASQYPLDELLHYNEVDTQLPLELYAKLVNKVDGKLLKFYSDMIYLFADIEMNGLCVDEGKLSGMYNETKAKLALMETELLSMLEYPININSGQQLSCALYGGTFQTDGMETIVKQYKKGPKEVTRKCKVDVTLKGLGFGTSKLKQTASGYWPTSADVILKLKGKTKVAKDYIELYRKYNKLNTLYVKSLVKYVNCVEYGYVHPTFNMSNTYTGRTSCTEPPAQQISRVDESLPNIKSIFVSRFGKDGRLLEVDFSSFQWVLAAYLSGDKRMLQDIRDGIDPHRNTAATALSIPYDEVTHEQRQSAKAVNFGLIFGQGAYGFMMRDDVPMVKTQRDGERFINAVYANYPQLKQWHDKNVAIAGAKGRLETLSGRWFDFSGDWNKRPNILNYPVIN